MTNDEQAIRDLYATWQRATADRDLATVMSLMAEDVVFLMPGQPPIRGREEFAALAADNKFHIESASEFGELVIHGDWAHCWCRLSVTMIPPEGGPVVRRSGHTLTILQKQSDGSWVVARDANMLAPDPGPQ